MEQRKVPVLIDLLTSTINEQHSITQATTNWIATYSLKSKSNQLRLTYHQYCHQTVNRRVNPSHVYFSTHLWIKVYRLIYHSQRKNESSHCCSSWLMRLSLVVFNQKFHKMKNSHHTHKIVN